MVYYVGVDYAEVLVNISNGAYAVTSLVESCRAKPLLMEEGLAPQE